MSIKLVADGGEITVGARVAVYTYGAFNVALPEGRELAQDDYTDDRYTNGYVYRPKEAEQLGRFDIAFARADVTVETNAGYSNFEAVVDASQRKVAEDVYFERDITGAGLGSWTPGEDYEVGDIVDVLVFNRVIPQPVTAITYTSAPDDPLGVRVHVGGQTIRDAELVEEQNRSVREAIAQESAQRRKQVGAAQSTATAAKATADNAQHVAQTAGTTAIAALQSANNKSTSYYGTTTPNNPKQGDTWFKETPSGTIIYQYRNDKWIEHLNTETLNHELDEARRAVGDAAEKVRQLDTELAKFPDSLAAARQELDGELTGLAASLSALGSGNLFPDPHFQDACWGTSGVVYSQRNINGGELRIYATGRRRGVYYQPNGKPDASMVLEPSAAYRLAATAWRSSDFDGQFFNVFMRYRNAKSEMKVFHVANIALTADGTNPVSATFVAPADMLDGSCTLGFYIEGNATKGRISLWNMTVVRASDSSLITDGAVKTQHMVAGTIDGDRIQANTLHADRIVSHSLTSQQIAADAIMARNIAANQVTAQALAADAVTADKIAARALTSDKMVIANGFIRTAMVGDSQITNAKIANLDAAKITSGYVDAGRIRAGSIDASKIKADSITVKELRAGTIVPIGGSLIHHEPTEENPTVPEPIWWQVCRNELPDSSSEWARPEGHPWRAARSGLGKTSSVLIPKRLVKVQPGQKYRLKLWVKANKANSRMTMKMYGQDGRNAVKSGMVFGNVTRGKYRTAKEAGLPWPVADFTNEKKGWNLVTAFEVPTEATLITSTIEFKDNVEYAYLHSIEYNEELGETTDAYQWIAGLSLELDIPDQAQIDALQDKQIEDNKARIADAEKYRVRMGSGNGYTSDWFSPHGNKFVEVRSSPAPGSIKRNRTTARLKQDCQGWLWIMHTTEKGLSDMSGFNVKGKKGDEFSIIGGLNQQVDRWILMYQLW